MDKLKRDDERESYCCAPVDQRIGHLAFTQSSAGSSPAGSIDGCNALLGLYQLWLADRAEYERQLGDWSQCGRHWLN